MSYSFSLQHPPQYHDDRQTCLRLLQNHDSYMAQLQEIANRKRKVFTLDLDDVAKLESDTFASKIETNFLRYTDMLCSAIDELLPEPTINLEELDRIDVLMNSRDRMKELHNDDTGPSGKYLKDLTRRYEVQVSPRSDTKPLPVRLIGAQHIGRLVTVTGLVTRITAVKPLLLVATYTCDACGFESYQQIRTREFMPKVQCETEICKQTKKAEKLHMQTRGSKFLKYQELTIQESPDQVPIGSIPRTMKVHVRGETVRSCAAGEKIRIVGVLLPKQMTGFRAMRAGLSTSSAFDAIKIEKIKKGYVEQEQSEDEVFDEVKELSEDRDHYSKLAQSIAPEIFGMEDVKKALLLLMVGGVTKKIGDGLSIRGDINILLMGDPGVAKSQLLKHITNIAPRAVYTTGRGSSGAGLTAAVLRDPVSDEMVLEGGALVLADMGICCIDEFDKMEDSDRTAIHEVMEQQTISIAKAGICTTLNARAAILAAANPVFGRYNKKKTPEENIELPAALMSRFDLLFILVDTPERDYDTDLARHICYVHQHKRHPPLDFDAFPPSFIRAYISHARTFEPTIPRELTQFVVGTYVQTRIAGREQNAKRLLPTPRTLLSILRLSQALARLRFSNEVDQSDLEEATRLMHESRSSMLDDEDENAQIQDAMTRIYSFIKEFMTAREIKSVKLVDMQNALRMKGFLAKQIEDTLERYEALDIWMFDRSRTNLILVD